MGKHKQVYSQNPSGTRKRSFKSKAARLRWQKMQQLPLLKSISDHFDKPGTSGLQRLPEVVSNPTTLSEETSDPEIMNLQTGTKELCEKSTEERSHTPPDNWSFIPEADYNRIEAHKLYFEINHSPKEPTVSGNRIVDLQYVLSWSIDLQYRHSQICTGGKLYLKEECNRGLGLVSCLMFACTMCDKIYKHYTEDISQKSKINYGFVRLRNFSYAPQQ